jgi:hypothetical protein
MQRPRDNRAAGGRHAAIVVAKRRLGSAEGSAILASQSMVPVN